MLKKATVLTLPTPARQDAPLRRQGRSERPKIVLPSSPVYFILRGWPGESPTARVQRGPSQAARCASTGDSPGHPSFLLADFFSILLELIFGAAKTGTAWAAVHRAPVSITRAKTDCRFKPGSASHRFNRPTRRSLRGLREGPLCNSSGYTNPAPIPRRCLPCRAIRTG